MWVTPHEQHTHVCCSCSRQNTGVSRRRDLLWRELVPTLILCQVYFPPCLGHSSHHTTRTLVWLAASTTAIPLCQVVTGWTATGYRHCSCSRLSAHILVIRQRWMKACVCVCVLHSGPIQPPAWLTGSPAQASIRPLRPPASPTPASTRPWSLEWRQKGLVVIICCIWTRGVFGDDVLHMDEGSCDDNMLHMDEGACDDDVMLVAVDIPVKWTASLALCLRWSCALISCT